MIPQVFRPLNDLGYAGSLFRVLGHVKDTRDLGHPKLNCGITLLNDGNRPRTFLVDPVASDAATAVAEPCGHFFLVSLRLYSHHENC